MDKITTTIKREWLREIVAGRKPIEYREIKPYWIRRFSGIKPPFLLRLINGMQSNTPEVTVVVRRIRKDSRSGQFELHIGKIVEVLHWDIKRGEPATNPKPKSGAKEPVNKQYR
jgi:hypothetical protein